MRCVADLQTKLSDNYSGKVIEVVSGDCLVIKDSASGLERRVNLSRWGQGTTTVRGRGRAGLHGRGV